MDNNILDIIDNFKNKKILVLGDSILDVNIYGEYKGESLETPVPDLLYQKEEIFFGGASNVVKNILELGGKVSFITLLGYDNYLSHYKNLNHENLNFLPIIDKSRKNIIIKRFWSKNPDRKYLHINHRESGEINEESKKKAIELINKEIDSSDIIIVIDPRHGMMSKDLIEQLKKIAKDKNKKIIVNSQVFHKEPNHFDYKGVHLIIANQREAKMLDSNFSLDNLNYLKNKLDSNICITLGNQGALIDHNNSRIKVEGIKVEEKDSVGAGDCFIAALSLSDLEKNPREAIYIANCWAGLSVKEIGTKTPKLNELTDYIKSNY